VFRIELKTDVVIGILRDATQPTQQQKQVKLKSEQEPMVQGELFAEIKQEDSTWTIRECCFLSFSFLFCLPLASGLGGRWSFRFVPEN
jgi:hypothetical protein